jgi:hypothetical protein
VCFAAKQVGVQTLIVGSDGKTLISIANDCEPGLQARYVYTGLLASNQMLSVQVLQGIIQSPQHVPGQGRSGPGR